MINTVNKAIKEVNNTEEELLSNLKDNQIDLFIKKITEELYNFEIESAEDFKKLEELSEKQTQYKDYFLNSNNIYSIANCLNGLLKAASKKKSSLYIEKTLLTTKIDLKLVLDLMYSFTNDFENLLMILKFLFDNLDKLKSDKEFNEIIETLFISTSISYDDCKFLVDIKFKTSKIILNAIEISIKQLEDVYYDTEIMKETKNYCKLIEDKFEDYNNLLAEFETIKSEGYIVDDNKYDFNKFKVVTL